MDPHDDPHEAERQVEDDGELGAHPRRIRLVMQTAVVIIERLRRRRLAREEETRAAEAKRLQDLHEKRQRSAARRKFWVRPWLARRHLGAYSGLMLELANEDVPGYIAFQRMAPELFQELLQLIQPHIQKQTTNMRKPISPGERLAITLRFLATGKLKLTVKN